MENVDGLISRALYSSLSEAVAPTDRRGAAAGVYESARLVALSRSASPPAIIIIIGCQ